jgi:hypothetical protein
LSLVTLKRNHEYKYNIIIAASGLFLGVALVTMLSGPVFIPTSSGLSMDDISACRVKIIGFEQIGYYSSPEQFRTAESFCYVK